ncbi:MAG: hypothetical protein ACRC17_02065 [Culicoidibacterales bacterium]
MQNQKLVIDFKEKKNQKATFAYKKGDIDKNGVQATLRNIDLTNATAEVIIKNEAESFSDKGEVQILDDVATFKLPTMTSETWFFELVVTNENGIETSARFSYRVFEKLELSDELQIEYETLHTTISEAFKKWQEDHERYEQTNSTLLATNAKAEAKINEVTVATTNANEATSDARTAITEANTATAKANTAATNATNATTNANKAITEANTATAKANESANLAIDATIKANQAIENTESIINLGSEQIQAQKSEYDEFRLVADAKIIELNETNVEAESVIERMNDALQTSSIDTEVLRAREDSLGVEHKDLKARIDSDFDKITKQIPKVLTASGEGSITLKTLSAGTIENVQVHGFTAINLVDAGDEITYTKNFYDYYKLKKDVETCTIFTFIDGDFDQYRLRMWASEFGSSGLDSIATYTQPGVYREVVETIIPYDQFAPYCLTGDECTIKTVIIEGAHPSLDIDFFRETQHAYFKKISTCGKNLFGAEKGELVQRKGYNNAITKRFNNGFEVTGGAAGMHGILSQKLKPNTQYVLTFEQEDDGVVAGAHKTIRSINNEFRNSDDINLQPTLASATTLRKFVFTTLEDTQCIAFTYYGNRDNLKTTIKNIYLYESHDAKTSEYIQFEFSEAEVSASLKLKHLPCGVSDIYDFRTKTAIFNCWETILFGYEGWHRAGTQTSSYAQFRLALPDSVGGTINFENARCDKFNWDPSGAVNASAEAFTIDSVYGLCISIAKEKLRTVDVEGFEEWLEQNPVYLLYQLSTPQTRYYESVGELLTCTEQTNITTDTDINVKINAELNVDLQTWLENQSDVVSTTIADVAQQVLIFQKNQANDAECAFKAIVELYEQTNNELKTLNNSKVTAVANVYKQLVRNGEREFETLPQEIINTLNEETTR